MSTTLQRIIACYALLLFSLIADAQVVVVVDNDDGSPAYTEVGSWATSGSTGYDGGTYRFGSAGGARSATWTASLPDAGYYEVFVWYVAGSNRATSTRYDVAANDGTHTVYINQTGGGLTWETLGTYPFNAGNNSITLNGAGSSGGTMIADAVRFGGESGGDCTVDSTNEVRPDVYHTAYTCPAPRAIHVLEFDLANPRYTMDMGFAHGKRNYSSNETISQIASRYDTAGNDVVGAINASYSEPGLSILGMLGTGGNLISTRDDTWWDQQTYMLQQSGVGWAGSDLASANMVATFEDSTAVEIDILDLPCSANSVNLYTPDWDSSTRSTSQGVEVVVENVNYPLRPNKQLVGTITAVQTGSASLNNSIPADGFVLAACAGAESEILSHATVGDLVSIQLDMSPLDLANMKTLCTGNAWMVKDGAPFHGGGPERHPRTVLAWSGTRHWFVTFDGRQPGYSVGASVEEMQDFLIDTLQVENAINLDGGGSTTMVVDGSVVNCPSDGATTPCTGTERLLPNALLLVDRDATTPQLPLADDFGATGRSLSWDDKFRFNPVVPFAPAAPGSDGHALEVRNPLGGFESVSIGSPADADYSVEAWVYCDYRPGLSGDGYDRVGIFARDDGNANFESASVGGGNCYALTFDSDDGRIQAAVVQGGIVTDFLASSPLLAQSSAWRQLRITCAGDSIRYFVDDAEIANVTDTTRAHGRCGIGYHEYFATDDNAQAAYADGFVMRGLFFDIDGDGDLDLNDYAAFAGCIDGPQSDYSPGDPCLFFDSDGDEDVDLADYSTLLEMYTGAS
jgi:hypothetical protein